LEAWVRDVVRLWSDKSVMLRCIWGSEEGRRERREGRQERDVEVRLGFMLVLFIDYGRREGKREGGRGEMERECV
jgi:hypothetical protein